MKHMFRTLKADEIEVRVGAINDNGCSLLLYKDARCDMNILDETVGPCNWERHHYECKGNLFCKVSIYNDGMWTSKADCGSESYTEKEKGEASDSFKRACVNWGIGRELYTAPFIWASNFKRKRKNGKFVCADKFCVSEIGYTDRKITKLVIKNEADEVVYSYPKPVESQEEIKESDSKSKTVDEIIADMIDVGNKNGFSNDEIEKISLSKFNTKPTELSVEQATLLQEQFVDEKAKITLRNWLNKKRRKLNEQSYTNRTINKRPGDKIHSGC